MPRPPTPPPDLPPSLSAPIPLPPPSNPLHYALSVDGAPAAENLFNSAMASTNSASSVKKATTFVSPKYKKATKSEGVERHSDDEEVEQPPADPQLR